MDLRKLGLAGTPLVAFTILALALRSGAPDETRAAVVYGAPPAKSSLGLAWQVFTVDEARGFRQPVAITHLSVTARAKGREVAWDGSSNADGIAEAWLELPGIVRGDPIELVVRDATLDDVLARGVAKWGGEAWVDRPSAPPWSQPGRREGEVLMDDGRTEIVGPGAICVHHPHQLHGISTVGDTNLVYITVSEKSERKPKTT